MKKLLVLTILSLFCLSLSAQNFTYKWQRTAIDSTYESNSVTTIDEIIARYSPGMESLMEIVGYSSEELSKAKPESGLSNLAADALIFSAKPFLKEGDMVLSITNFGGIRTSLPKGAIRVYDVMSVFPFNNKTVIVDILGKDLRIILDKFAKRGNFEAMGGVCIVVNGGKMTKCEIGGKPLNDKFVYRLVTIDFLIDGGDRMNLGEYAIQMVNTERYIRDDIISYLKAKSAEGVVFSNQRDGRIVINKK